jgi:hypothetical protein
MTFLEGGMKMNFGREHLITTADECSPLGYPDDGNGRYTQRTSYVNWYL